MIYRNILLMVLLVFAVSTVRAKDDIKKEKSTGDILDVNFYGLDIVDNGFFEASTVTDSPPPVDNQQQPEPGRGGRSGRFRRSGHYHHGGGRRRGNYGGYGPCNGGSCYGGRHGHGGCTGMGCMNGGGMGGGCPNGNCPYGGGRGGGPWWMQPGVTTEDQMAYVCELLRSSPGSSGRPESMMTGVDDETRDAMIAVWNRRRDEMINCCNMETADEKLQCVRDVQTRRFDRVCAGEEPFCPWALLRGNSDTQSILTSRCCALNGSGRNECFLNGMRDQRLYGGCGWGHGHGYGWGRAGGRLRRGLDD